MQFTLQDPQTGRTVTVEGASVPPMAQREQIFQQAGLRPKAPQPQGKSTTQNISDIFRTLGLGLLPNAAANVTDVAKVPFVGGTQIGSPNYQNPFRTPQEVIQQYPALAKRNVSGAKLNPGEALKEEAQNVMNTGKDAAGSYSWALPGLDLLKGRSILGPLLSKVATGGLRGEGYGISQGEGTNPAYAAAGAVLDPLMAASKLALHPMNTLGSARAGMLPNVATGDVEKGIMDKLFNNNTYFNQAPAETQVAARTQASKFLTDLNPLQQTGDTTSGAVKPAETSLADVYKNLSAFEKMGKAYGRGGDVGSTALSQGTNLTSHAVRSYLRDASPWQANALTTIMKGGYGLQGDAVKRILGILGVGTLGTEGIRLLQGLTKPAN